MKIKINRTQKKIQIPSNADISVSNILKQNGYKHVNVLDIENYKNIQWDGNEFNRLFTKNNILYRFNEWVGEKHPYKAIEIEEIGQL